MVRRQAELLQPSRSSAHYTPRPLSEGDLGLTRRLDKLCLIAPFPRVCISDLQEALPQCVSPGIFNTDERPQLTTRDAMKKPEDIEILFVAGFGPVVDDRQASRKLYQEAFGISFKEEKGGYLHTEALEGVKTFALWPLSEAAQSCFGKDSWPKEIPVPQAWLEFEVDSVENATAALELQGYRMLIRSKREPWGQTVSRFISPENLLVAVTFTPSMREGK